MSRFWLFWSCYVGLGLVCSVIEHFRPARKLNFWRLDALPLDLVAAALFQFVFYSAASQLVDRIPVKFMATRAMLAFPLPLRIVAYYLLGDFGSYWIHRLIHKRHLWRVHKFHHSVTQLWWLSGVRATIPQQFLFNLPYMMWAPLLVGASQDVFHGLMVAGIVTNHWMHMNVSWRSNWLEKIIITPRFHHVHHSANALEHDGNYGTVFTIWDRMFGTFIDPDATEVKEFGLGEPLRPTALVRYVIGV